MGSRFCWERCVFSAFYLMFAHERAEMNVFGLLYFAPVLVFCFHHISLPFPRFFCEGCSACKPLWTLLIRHSSIRFLAIKLNKIQKSNIFSYLIYHERYLFRKIDILILPNHKIKIYIKFQYPSEKKMFHAIFGCSTRWNEKKRIIDRRSSWISLK